MSAVAELHPEPFAYDERLGDHALAGSYDQRQIDEWKSLLARHVPA